MFINDELIKSTLLKAKELTKDEISLVFEKAKSGKALELTDIAALLNLEDKEDLDKLFALAGEIKNKIYGKRVVIFAPLYISNYCVNNCSYCGYKCKNRNLSRRKLSYEEIQEEVLVLEKMGHKRLALEVGEDPKNCPIDYILEAIDAIYKTKLESGSIRRVNVNIAATTAENYKKLKEKGIGTYILFQETYDRETYENVHESGPKSNYEYHLTAFDRAMEAGIDDVGAGALFGLYDYKYEVLGLILHNKHLEEKFNVGFHTVSVPRLKKAENMELSDYKYIPTDEEFKKIVAVLRIALPFTGIIMSTRETMEMRRDAINFGVSQISAGSCTGIGGYKKEEESKNTAQFEISDSRKPNEVVLDLLKMGFIPSYCTACYRQGRTGDRFMSLAKTGNIQNVCTPNALMTLMEYILDHGDKELYKEGEKLILKEIESIENEKIKALTKANIEKLKNGERDLFV